MSSSKTICGIRLSLETVSFTFSKEFTILVDRNGGIMANTEKITDDTFESEVINAQGTVLVDFWAEWCRPCLALGPKLEELASEMADQVKIKKINIDENRESAAKYGVRSIPTMILFKNGQVVEQLVGNLPKEDIQSKISAHV